MLQCQNYFKIIVDNLFSIHRNQAVNNQAGSHATSSHTRATLALIATVIIWSTPNLFQYYLNGYFDVWTQNAYRYLAGFLAILPFSLFRASQHEKVIPLRVKLKCLLPVAPNVVHQITQTLAVVYLLPGMYSVISRFSVIIIAVFAIILFADERWLLRSRLFQFSLLMGLSGTIGVVAFRKSFSIQMETIGLIYAFIGLVTWALYAVSIKKCAASIPASASFSIISLATSSCMIVLAGLFGDLSAPFHAPLMANIALFGSGVLCIGFGHVLFITSIQQLGTTLAQSVQLLCPLGAVLLSAWIFKEQLTIGQYVSGFVLLFGALLALLANRRS